MKIGPLGLWELLMLFLVFGLPLWAIILAATRQGLSQVARILLVGIAVVAPVVGPLGVIIATPLLTRRRPV